MQLQSDNNNNLDFKTDAQSRITELERTVLALQSENKTHSDLNTYLLGTFSFVEDTMVENAGWQHVLEVKQGNHLNVLNGLSRRLAPLDRANGRLKVLEKKQNIYNGQRIHKKGNNPLKALEKKEGGRFLDLSDPVGLRRMAGVLLRDGLEKRWTWVPVRFVLYPSLLSM